MKAYSLGSSLFAGTLALTLAACATNSGPSPAARATSTTAAAPMAPLPSAPLTANPTLAASLPPISAGMPANPATSDPAPITIQANGQPAPVDFDKQVQPFFATYCFQCHGPRRQSGRTRYDTKTGILMRVTPGDPANSILYTNISSTGRNHMPPATEDQPTADEVAMIKQWITEGAKISDSYPVNAPAPAPAQ